MLTKENAEKFINEVIQEGTKYVVPMESKTITASMFGNTLLQNYLIVKSRMTGIETEEEDIGQATLGSIFHVGMQAIMDNVNICEDTQIMTEHKMVKEMHNGWFLSGTADLIVADEKNQKASIFDYKLTKVYAGKMVKKEPATHGYVSQIAVLQYLREPLQSNGFLLMFYKDANPIKHEPAFEVISVETSFHDVESMFKDIADSIDRHLEEDTEPAQCDDLWWRKIGGKSIPTRCEIYCNVKHICPYKHDLKKETTIATW